MVAFVLALASWAGDRADVAVIGHWLQAAASGSQFVKYEALGRGLRAIDRKQYSSRRADAIGLLYGSLLVQDVPLVTKRRICQTLTGMDGLDSSVDVLLGLAGAYKAADAPAAAAIAQSGWPGLTTKVRWLESDAELADDLIASLWTRKSEGRSHFSSRLVRFPPLRGGASQGFSR